MITVILLASFPGLGQVDAATIYVPDDYSSIQAAVDAANPGDTIIVRDGTYNEHVVVSKEHLTIASENGPEATIVQGTGTSADQIFLITSDYVSLSGFTLKGDVGYWSPYGIRLSISEEHCNISNNTVTDCCGGISVGGYNNNIMNNTFLNNYYGMNVGGSNNTLVSNVVLDNSSSGILLNTNGSNNTLIDNLISGSQCNFGTNTWGFNTCSIANFIHSINTSNKVDGKPIYYWVNEKDKQVPTDAGYVGLIGCTNITVKDLSLSNNYQGVLLINTNALCEFFDIP